jgi:hypothetical protein
MRTVGTVSRSSQEQGARSARERVVSVAAVRNALDGGLRDDAAGTRGGVAPAASIRVVAPARLHVEERAAPGESPGLVGGHRRMPRAPGAARAPRWPTCRRRERVACRTQRATLPNPRRARTPTADVAAALPTQPTSLGWNPREGPRCPRLTRRDAREDQRDSACRVRLVAHLVGPTACYPLPKLHLHLRNAPQAVCERRGSCRRLRPHDRPLGAALLLLCRAPRLPRSLWWPSSPTPFSRR